MKLYNLTRNTRLPYEVIVCNNFFARLKGMMFLKKEEALGRAYLIYPCSSIHTFFMNFSITAVFMLKTGDVFEIKKIIEGLSPRKIIPYVPGSNSVLEFIPPGQNIDYFDINDKIELSGGAATSPHPALSHKGRGNITPPLRGGVGEGDWNIQIPKH